MEFCNESNILEALNTLNEEIAVLGYEQLLEYDCRENNQGLIISLCNTAHSLKVARQNFLDKCRAHVQNQRVLDDEIKSLKAKIKQMEDEKVQLLKTKKHISKARNA
uniref:Uncharacterized protein n=1 Tax=Clastoptera arizonana TaxID=38151 RepID=A0A1B6C7L2_9HEMI